MTGSAACGAQTMIDRPMHRVHFYPLASGSRHLIPSHRRERPDDCFSLVVNKIIDHLIGWRVARRELSLLRAD